jgi:putative ABC transport system permease protein
LRKISLIASDDGVRDFIDFHSGDESLEYPGVNEALLSVGAAEAMGIRVGDEISLRNADMQTLKLKVTGIYDNHVDNFVLVHPDTVERQWGEQPEMQMAFVTLKEGADMDQLSGKITGMSDVMNISVSQDFADMVRSMMDALDLVVVVVVVCAGLLAATVLYNLTNININERIREIATIKVLGFNAKETAMYVFKENLSLTVIGSGLGLGLGYFLLLFIMSQIKLDIVWFKAIITPMSYVASIVLTILAAIVVDFVFYFKLDKINMAEALKSVE